MTVGAFLHCSLSCAQVRAPELMEPTRRTPALGAAWLGNAFRPIVGGGENEERQPQIPTSGPPKVNTSVKRGPSFNLTVLAQSAIPLSVSAACPDPHPFGCQDPSQRPDGTQQGEHVSTQQDSSERWVYPDSPCPAQWQYLLCCQHLFSICGNSLLPLLPLSPLALELDAAHKNR